MAVALVFVLGFFSATLDLQDTVKIINDKSRFLTGLHPKQYNVSQVGRPQDSRHCCMDIFYLCELLSSSKQSKSRLEIIAKQLNIC